TVIGPLRLALNPITDAIADLKEIPKQFIEDWIRGRCGLDVEEIEFLLGMNNKMDVKSFLHQNHNLAIFGPNDHAKIDAYMGINGIVHSEELSELLQDFPGLGIEFYPNAKTELSNNVEFDKTKFAAYADSVTLCKLLLLRDDAIPNDTDMTS